jgi:hypothetical protein
LTPSEVRAVLDSGYVPEHSVVYMAAMSGGEPFMVGPYLFIAAGDWVLAIGYPLGSAYSSDSFESALTEALRKTRARNCWAVCPSLPGKLKSHARTVDRYYLLSLDAAVPARASRQAGRAAASLRVEESNVFTGEHRRLWAEFMARAALPSNVREMFARTEAVLQKAPCLSLLNAWDRQGRLSASLLLDSAPRRFTTYLIGAHSRAPYTPYATDLLFLEMIRTARQQGKEFLHLGLGVNEGIRRFKSKWGGRPELTYEMAEWQEKERLRHGVGDFARIMVAMQSAPVSKREVLANLPRQRRFAMLWEVEKTGRLSWVAGTAHFFCYSFENSFRRLFEHVETVLFEGPLDKASLDRVSEVGRTPDPEGPRLIDAMTEEEIRRLERVVCGPQGFWPRLLGLQSPSAPDVRYLLSQTRPWMAFFTIWSAFLARRGWTHSVDLEAWRLAHEMGKTVVGMETIPEQVDTLQTIPIPRIVNFFRQCRSWAGYMRRNMRAYLKGDLEGMSGTGIEFPSRTQTVIHRRDASFLSRMQPFLEEGRCAVFVGSAHLLNLRQMLTEAGYSVRRSR